MRKSTPTKKLQNLVNHVVFVLDESQSMMYHSKDVISVFSEQIKFLSQRSQQLNQETRVSIYKFNTSFECIIYDMDVMRTPSLDGLYRPSGMTALLDATGEAISDLKMTPTKYGDHAFLMFVLTDGIENASREFSPTKLRKEIESLSNNWTFGALVPNSECAEYTERCGFTRDSIAEWDVGATDSIQKVGKTIQKATESFFTGRAKGVRSTKGLFTVGEDIQTTEVKSNLSQMSPAEYMILHVRKDGPIREFVESWKIPYIQGGSYYQLMKKEKIQPSKNVLIKDKKNGRVYEGAAARQLLGLPDHEVRVSPADNKQFDIFIQSTSVNRKLIAGTELIVLK